MTFIDAICEESINAFHEKLTSEKESPSPKGRAAISSWTTPEVKAAYDRVQKKTHGKLAKLLREHNDAVILALDERLNKRAG